MDESFIFIMLGLALICLGLIMSVQSQLKEMKKKIHKLEEEIKKTYNREEL